MMPTHLISAMSERRTTERGRHSETFDGYGAVEFVDMEKPG
jgi:hypothetical protein